MDGRSVRKTTGYVAGDHQAQELDEEQKYFATVGGYKTGDP